MELSIEKVTAETSVVADKTTGTALPLRSVSKQGSSTGQQQQTAQTAQPLDINATRELAERIQQYLDTMNINIAFSTYGGDNKISITVMNKETGEIIRQIPPEELQRLHMKMEELIGMILNERA